MYTHGDFFAFAEGIRAAQCQRERVAKRAPWRCACRCWSRERSLCAARM